MSPHGLNAYPYCFSGTPPVMNTSPIHGDTVITLIHIQVISLFHAITIKIIPKMIVALFLPSIFLRLSGSPVTIVTIVVFPA